MSTTTISKRFIRSAVPCVLGLALLGGCGGDDDSDDEGASVPSISALEFTPGTVTVGQLAAINGTFAFNDEDGNVNTIVVDLKGPDNVQGAILRSPSPSLAGAKTAKAAFAIQLNAPAAGTYPFELWVTDVEENESNHLTGALEAR